MLYKCLVFAGQEDFLSNIVHLSNVGSMLGWPNIKTALYQCLVWVVSCNQFSGYNNAVNLYSIGYCWPTLDRPRHARFAAGLFFKAIFVRTSYQLVQEILQASFCYCHGAGLAINSQVINSQSFLPECRDTLARSSTYKDFSMPFDRASIMLFILMVNEVGEIILSCGTPSSFEFRGAVERVLSQRTLNFLPLSEFSQIEEMYPASVFRGDL